MQPVEALKAMPPEQLLSAVRLLDSRYVQEKNLIEAELAKGAKANVEDIDKSLKQLREIATEAEQFRVFVEARNTALTAKKRKIDSAKEAATDPEKEALNKNLEHIGDALDILVIDEENTLGGHVIDAFINGVGKRLAEIQQVVQSERILKDGITTDEEAKRVIQDVEDPRAKIALEYFAKKTATLEEQLSILKKLLDEVVGKLEPKAEETNPPAGASTPPTEPATPQALELPLTQTPGQTLPEASQLPILAAEAKIPVVTDEILAKDLKYDSKVRNSYLPAPDVIEQATRFIPHDFKSSISAMKFLPERFRKVEGHGAPPPESDLLHNLFHHAHFGRVEHQGQLEHALRTYTENLKPQDMSQKIDPQALLEVPAFAALYKLIKERAGTPIALRVQFEVPNKTNLTSAEILQQLTQQELIKKFSSELIKAYDHLSGPEKAQVDEFFQKKADMLKFVFEKQGVTLPPIAPVVPSHPVAHEPSNSGDVPVHHDAVPPQPPTSPSLPETMVSDVDKRNLALIALKTTYQKQLDLINGQVDDVARKDLVKALATSGTDPAAVAIRTWKIVDRMIKKQEKPGDAEEVAKEDLAKGLRALELVARYDDLPESQEFFEIVDVDKQVIQDSLKQIASLS